MYIWRDSNTYVLITCLDYKVALIDVRPSPPMMEKSPPTTDEQQDTVVAPLLSRMMTPAAAPIELAICNTDPCVCVHDGWQAAGLGALLSLMH